MNYIIGCGGVGGWLAQLMCKLVKPANITLIDGDTIEERNIERQLFSDDDIGENKATTLARRLKCQANPGWYSEFMFQHGEHDWLLCCVDNNPARASALSACDRFGCRAIIGANEVHSSEAYVYHPDWDGMETLDPRQYYPELSQDRSGNRMAISAGCTGEEQEKNVQLATANFMAAALMSHLYVVWAMEARKVKRESHAYMPNRLVQNLTRSSFTLRGEIKP